MEAARPEQAFQIYEHSTSLRGKKELHVETGRFGAMMDVALINDGPVTLIIESKK